MSTFAKLTSHKSGRKRSLEFQFLLMSKQELVKIMSIPFKSPAPWPLSVLSLVRGDAIEKMKGKPEELS